MPCVGTEQSEPMGKRLYSFTLTYHMQGFKVSNTCLMRLLLLKLKLESYAQFVTLNCYHLSWRLRWFYVMTPVYC